jgi:F-type H+-transporting ATPase subunit delta
MRVTVTTAVPLPDDQRERLRQELREKYKKEPVLTTKVDPALLGGLVVKVGDWLYDASVRTRLTNIRKQLIERGSHATV